MSHKPVRAARKERDLVPLHFVPHPSDETGERTTVIMAWFWGHRVSAKVVAGNVRASVFPCSNLRDPNQDRIVSLAGFPTPSILPPKSSLSTKV